MYILVNIFICSKDLCFEPIAIEILSVVITFGPDNIFTLIFSELAAIFDLSAFSHADSYRFNMLIRPIF